MAQNLFAGTVPPATNSLPLLDANFTELYGFSKNLVSDGSGNVAIGTATPTASFDVLKTFAGQTLIKVRNASTAAGAFASVEVTASTAVLGLAAFGSGHALANQVWVYNTTANPLVFGINGSEKARFDASGNLLINRAAQASGGKLEVAGNVVLQPAAGAPTLTVNGDMSFQLVSNTSLKILVRGSDGTTRSVTLTLA